MPVVTTSSPGPSPTPQMTAFIACVELCMIATSDPGRPSTPPTAVRNPACRSRAASTPAALIRPRANCCCITACMASHARSGSGPAPPVFR